MTRVKFLVDGKDGYEEAETIVDLLDKLDIPKSSAITVVNGRVRPENYRLKDGECVEIIIVSTRG